MKFDKNDKLSIKNLFNQVAYNYDKLNDFMSFGLQNNIKEKAVKNLIQKLPTNNLKILDLCCGTGDISILLKKIFPDSEIIGVDFSENMLKIAKSKTVNITFYNCDVTNLGHDFPFNENSFDLCFISFGLRNLPDIDNFLKHIKSYLKTDGILSILDLGKPYFITKPYFYFHYEFFIPLFAYLFNKDITPYKYFTNSSKSYPSQKEMVKKLNKYGYKNIENINYFCGIIAQQIAFSK